MKKFRFLFVALTSVVCLLGFNSCDKDEEGLASTTWYAEYDTRISDPDYVYHTINYHYIGSYTYTFNSTTCNYREISDEYKDGIQTSNSWDTTSTWYYDETNYPTILLTKTDFSATATLYISGNSFTSTLDKSVTIYKK